MQTLPIDPADLFRLVQFFDILAAVVFAVSGALVASRKGMDVMGFMWLAVITGVGGGTVRDLILDVPVFWVQNPIYVSVCLATAVVMHFVAPRVKSRYRTLLWFDAFGLALVTVAGTVKALEAGVPALVAIAMGAVTVLWVGGAGGLEVTPGVRVVDDPSLPAWIKPGSLATINALEQLRAEPTLDWSFLAPSAELHPGERTGKFRLGGDELLVDASGKSHISLQDFAVAMIDELDHPAHIRKRFTVGY